MAADFSANLAGSDMRAYEAIPMPHRRQAFPPDMPAMPDLPENVDEGSFGAQWLPDGKTICFSANGVLYTIRDD